ncbi:MULTISPECIES: phosphoribosylanthranilate isomerase [Shouchella]|uniref:phosphoribosylanthranilate isomerase n=1 Tax=Shouchella TaxID=2893057 RepID=UPI00091C1196|nr:MULTISPECIES: phosphoribosylanthranilate isomerase [Shouchella]MBX0318594.1 phosphoribosylanthranilate isomerase [Shouchella clausii]MDO7283151.1 phosphoribosylanthranilate isomerase [Shouchella clausii]MDO7303248.1 phosphoribosylanthranilate isomerase [Shouchella clausii]SHL05144.1 phosphoribosylanthranilate isomerase [Shouchella rhizosphaerae]
MKLKYCGLHQQEDVEVAAASHCDYMGFVLANSKRKVALHDVAQWLATTDMSTKQTVALFVNESLDTIAQVAGSGLFDVIQLHGSETPAFLQAVKDRTHKQVWKAIHHSSSALSIMQAFAGIADGYVIDCKSAKGWGGTGESFDWKQIPSYKEEGVRQGTQVLIAGGITPENVVELARYQVDGLDVSSGIEENGKKSVAKIARLEQEAGVHYAGNNTR